jgi:hypothetical protein
MVPVIVCIAKLESAYIEEFVKYHLALGFHKIYIYDNENVPTYKTLLKNYSKNIIVTHYPHNNYKKGVQYMVLDHFISNFMRKDGITHVAHIDIDEYIVLKKHKNITDFINEYIIGDCAGIGMNWRFFGSSNLKEKSDIPNTIRFTKCQEKGNPHVKTLFKVDLFKNYNSCHDIDTSNGYHVKSTNGSIIKGPFNHDIDFSIIQLNHYKCKTLPEFRYIRTRQRADIAGNINEDVDSAYKSYDINEIEDLTAHNFYLSLIS